MAQPKIAILLHDEFEMWRPPPWFVQKLRTEFPDIEIVYSAKKRDDEQALRCADVMIGWSLSPEQLRAAKSLRWIYSITAAVDQFLYPELISSEIAISNAGSVHGPVVAEHAIAMVLALAKRLPSAVRYQQRRKWAMEEIWNEQPRPREVRGSSAAVVGLGSIGAEVAAMAAALKMHVIGVREHPERGTSGAHDVLGYDALDVAIARADFVVLAAPLTERTRHMIDARRLRLFKPTAYLINVARGALVDEAALVKALRERRIAGAALDVFEEEPLSRWSPLWKMPQVLITPHTAFLTENVWQRHYEVFTANLKRYLAGQPLENFVDKKRGY
ncbi:MAG: D-isomer specific 2-hydroxyacid dehydrogenase, NAD-binding protein [Candidatus Angelobacter sp.]|nr:D-isomer specific 2-hydroxyacid dehydrogenase, NAD-binding protein [Candidatus Angelobacter sp.]